MDLRHALLGLLSEGHASGYELARRCERAPWRYAWHVHMSQIHSELYAMDRDGLATIVAGGVRRRRVYAITRTGQDELRRWLVSAPPRFVVRSEFVFRLLLIASLDPADARSLLTPLVPRCDAELDTLRAQADAGGRSSQDRFSTELLVRSVEALQQWALWALGELEQR